MVCGEGDLETIEIVALFNSVVFRSCQDTPGEAVVETGSQLSVIP